MVLSAVSIVCLSLGLSPAQHGPGAVESNAELAHYGNWLYADIKPADRRPWSLTLEPAEGQIFLQPADEGLFVIVGATLALISHDGRAQYRKQISEYADMASRHLSVASVALAGSAVLLHYRVPSNPIRSDIVALDRRTGEVLGMASITFGADKRIISLGAGVLCVSRHDGLLRYVRVPPQGEPQLFDSSLIALAKRHLAGRTVVFGTTAYHFRTDGGAAKLRLSEGPLGEPESCYLLPRNRVLATYYFPLESDSPQRQPPYTVATSLYEFDEIGNLSHRWTSQAPLADASGLGRLHALLTVDENLAWASGGTRLICFEPAGAIKRVFDDVQPIAGFPGGVLGIADGRLMLFGAGGVSRQLALLDPTFARDSVRQWTVAAGEHGVYIGVVRRTGEPAILFQPLPGTDHSSAARK